MWISNRLTVDMHVKRIDATETIDYVIMSCISRKSVPPNVHFP